MIVRAFGGVPLVRRVWEVDAEAVYVTDDGTFEKLLSGADAPFAIGFSRSDVVRYDAAVEHRIGTKDWRWEGLQPIA